MMGFILNLCHMNISIYHGVYTHREFLLKYNIISLISQTVNFLPGTNIFGFPWAENIIKNLLLNKFLIIKNSKFVQNVSLLQQENTQLSCYKFSRDAGIINTYNASPNLMNIVSSDYMINNTFFKKYFNDIINGLNILSIHELNKQVLYDSSFMFKPMIINENLALLVEKLNSFLIIFIDTDPNSFSFSFFDKNPKNDPRSNNNGYRIKHQYDKGNLSTDIVYIYKQNIDDFIIKEINTTNVEDLDIYIDTGKYFFENLLKPWYYSSNSVLLRYLRNMVLANLDKDRLEFAFEVLKSYNNIINFKILINSNLFNDKIISDHNFNKEDHQTKISSYLFISKNYKNFDDVSKQYINEFQAILNNDNIENIDFKKMVKIFKHSNNKEYNSRLMTIFFAKSLKNN